jgi:ADP-heptose:LPS heptosyltransferase
MKHPAIRRIKAQYPGAKISTTTAKKGGDSERKN